MRRALEIGLMFGMQAVQAQDAGSGASSAAPAAPEIQLAPMQNVPVTPDYLVGPGDRREPAQERA